MPIARGAVGIQIATVVGRVITINDAPTICVEIFHSQVTRAN